MKSSLKWCAVSVIVVLGLCQAPVVLAQSPVRAGLFGDRALGKPIAPKASGFGGELQNGPSGTFLYIGNPNGVTALPMPWRQLDSYATGPVAPIQLLAAQPTLSTSLLQTVPSQATGNPLLIQGMPSLPTALSSETGISAEIGTAGGTGQGGERSSGATAPSISNMASGAAWQLGTDPTIASGVRQSSSARSADLSDRLTQIAGRQAMLTGGRIEVYRTGGGAVLLGVVRTAEDRALLENILALEPGVWQIDNRLVVKQRD